MACAKAPSDLPEARTMPTAPRPGAVAMATIGSASCANRFMAWQPRGSNGPLSGPLLGRRCGVGQHTHAHLLVDEPLLRNRRGVVGQPVQHQTGREEEEHDGKRRRHDPHQPRLHRVGRGRVELDLQEGRCRHDGRQDVVRVFGRQIVYPENPRRAAQLHARQQHPVQRDEHRDLDHDRQAATQRIDLLLAVQLDHGLIHLRLIALVRLAQRVDARPHGLHARHRLIARRRQREERQLDQQREHDDRPAPVLHHFVDHLQQPENRLGQNGHPAVVLHQLKAGGERAQRALQLRADEQLGIGGDALARSNLRQRLDHPNRIQVVAQLAGIKVTRAFIGLRHPSRNEVVLNHGDPAAVRLLRRLVGLEILELELLELVGVVVIRRAGIGVIEVRLVTRRRVAVAHELHIHLRRHCGTTGVGDGVLHIHHIAVAGEGVGALEFDAAQIGRDQFDLQRLGVAHVARARQHRHLGFMVGKIAPDQARLRHVFIAQRIVEQDHVLARFGTALILEQFGIDQIAAARRNFHIHQIGADGGELGRGSGGRRCDRSGQRCRCRSTGDIRRRGRGWRRLRHCAGRRAGDLRRMGRWRSEQIRLAVVAQPGVVQKNHRHGENHPENRTAEIHTQILL